MKKVNSYIILAVLISVFGCDHSYRSPDKNIPAAITKDPVLIPSHVLKDSPVQNRSHPLSKKINEFLDNQLRVDNFEATSYRKVDYLKVIDRQVRAMLTYQDSSGRIIDPVEKTEKYYTTPCYAHSVAALLASSYIKKEDNLALSGMKALDIALTDMVNATVNGNHGDFYTWPVMLAYKLYRPFVSEERLRSWDKMLQSIDIAKLYRTYNQAEGNNWVLVHSAGEFLRATTGFTAFDYMEKMLGLQLANFTALGMYNEHGNPLPYDLFARHYMSGMLQLGYGGQQLEALRDHLWKGAWMSLFMQSPFGELPTGYRSSHHIWNEAEQCVIFEIYALAYAKRGSDREAGAFKRAAHLSLDAINRWIRSDGSGYIVKNRYPIENRHGYEGYSMHTCYNMLATSMLAQAWQFADDAITEYPSPADVGGFVVPILEPFHKVFANAGGTYLEYETRGDEKYNPTGFIRAHIKDGNPQLGPSNGLAPYFSGEGINIATGPSWQSADGSWVALAELRPKKPKVEILEESVAAVKFSLTYELGNSERIPDKITIIETFLIANGKITVTNEFKGLTGKKRINWPMLVFDGKETVKADLQPSDVSLELRGKGVNFKILSPGNIKLERSGRPLKHVNGIAEVVFAEFSGDKVSYMLQSKEGI
ncbi:hypothetical protein QQ020_32950 [Fulvivirgaceae bacterium BMA12]|uniref:Uncharacterized protein n=1 Tax=Agaribacillus aureus TaxID=3051825 RepID=A0ABT8LIS3_9BACT|nr:hypothetical protein [Fulvivirgaceae bacterium BMA12]